MSLARATLAAAVAGRVLIRAIIQLQAEDDKDTSDSVNWTTLAARTVTVASHDHILVLYSHCGSCNDAVSLQTRLSIDGTVVAGCIARIDVADGRKNGICAHLEPDLAAGDHDVVIEWKVSTSGKAAAIKAGTVPDYQHFGAIIIVLSGDVPIV